MVMVVTDPIFEERRRTGGLNAPDEALRNQDAQSVVHRLQRNGTNLGTNELGHGIGRDVRLTRDCPQDRQSLSCDLNAALTKEIGWLGAHILQIRSIL